MDLFSDPVVHRVMLKPTRVALENRIRARGGEWDELLLSSGALEWCYERLERLDERDVDVLHCVIPFLARRASSLAAFSV